MRGIHLLMRPEDSRIHSGRSRFSARRVVPRPARARRAALTLIGSSAGKRVGDGV